MKFSLHIKRRRAYEPVVTMIARTKNAAIDIRDASSSLDAGGESERTEEESEPGELCYAFGFRGATLAFDNGHVCHKGFMGTSCALTNRVYLGNTLFQ